MKFALDCKEMSRLTSQRLDQPDGHDLPLADRARMQLHLAVCQNCRNVDEQMDFLRRAMRGLGQDREDDNGPPRP